MVAVVRSTTSRPSALRCQARTPHREQDCPSRARPREWRLRRPGDQRCRRSAASAGERGEQRAEHQTEPKREAHAAEDHRGPESTADVQSAGVPDAVERHRGRSWMHDGSRRANVRHAWSDEHSGRRARRRRAAPQRVAVGPRPADAGRGLRGRRAPGRPRRAARAYGREAARPSATRSPRPAAPEAQQLPRLRVLDPRQREKSARAERCEVAALLAPALLGLAERLEDHHQLQTCPPPSEQREIRSGIGALFAASSRSVRIAGVRRSPVPA